MAKEIFAKSMLHHHEQTFATNWDANIYRGCEHKCVYCFAQYSHKYLEKDKFFDEIFVKINSAQILSKEFAKKKWGMFPVNLSGISDCYQPEEAVYKLMPTIIDTFAQNRNPLVIVTKSVLALRDIKLIEKLNQLVQVTVIVSVSTLDESKRVLIEPNAAPTIERLEMLKKFREIGCKTGVLFMPIIPYISDGTKNLDEMFRLCAEYKLGFINAWPLHLRGATKKSFYKFLNTHFSHLIPKYNELYKKGSASKEYKIWLHNKVESLRDKYNLFESYEISKPGIKETAQLSLFE